jgi:hypothetical protein
MNLELIRDFASPDVTLGTLAAPNGRKWQTLERPWVPIEAAPCGQKGISCIPPGIYRLTTHDSEAFSRVWALTNPMNWVYHWDSDVPAPQSECARTTVLIHPANWATELRGCIALGKQRTKQPNGIWMILNSRDAVNELRGAVNGTYDLTLTIGYAEGVTP